jgi:putative Mg2+ transporter-C (MgtC) family protein
VVDPIIRLVLAAALGAALGFEREVKQKSAGLRTNALIAAGAALFMMLSLQLGQDDGADPARIAAQIVTGIGFLGAGAILHTRHGVQGLTTAATIWMNAAIGMAVGAGYLALAAAAVVTTLAILVVLVPIERVLERRSAARDTIKDPSAGPSDSGEPG